MTIGPAPVCLSCFRLRAEADTPTCDAFPKGIPESIWTFGDDHSKSVKGDGGKTFLPIPGPP